MTTANTDMRSKSVIKALAPVKAQRFILEQFHGANDEEIFACHAFQTVLFAILFIKYQHNKLEIMKIRRVCANVQTA